MPRTTCLTPDELTAFQLGDLPEPALDEVAAHLETCLACEAAAAAMDRLVDTRLDPFRAGGRDTPPPPAHGLSREVGEHEILEEIGRGGMGVVYKARHKRLLRTVALKMLLGGTFANNTERARFRGEAEAVARLQHPNIVQLFEVGELADGDGPPRTWFTLEFVEGGSLADRLAGRPQPPEQAAVWVETLARAVHHAHEHGIVHRDLKPHNVLVTRAGQLKVCDFGVAKRLDAADVRTESGMLIGTVEYMAPEQAAGGAVGPAADVHALGAILYTLLTSRPPFQGTGVYDTLALVRWQEPAPPSRLQPTVRRDLETVCLKCLEKEPHRRYASAEALADDLHRFLAGEPVKARPVGRVGRAWKWARRNPVVAALLAAVFVSLAAGAGAFYWKYREAEAAAVAEAQEKRAAQQARAEVVAERDRAEVSEVTGLLRPLHAGSGLLSAEEAEALRDLRKLPSERLRVLFLERGLARPETAVKLHRRGAEVAHALAGLDRDRAARLCDVLTVRARGTADPRILDGCATLLAALMPRTGPKAAALAEVLTRRLAAEKEQGAVRELADRLAALAPHLGPGEAAVAAETVGRRLLADGTARPQLSALLVALAGRLDPARAAAVARPLARRIAEASNPDGFDQFAAPLAALLARLPEQEAAALAGKAVSTMSTLMFSKEYFPRFPLPAHVAALAVRMGEKEAEAAAQAMARALALSLNTPWKRPTPEVFLVLAARLGEGKRAAVLRPVVQRRAREVGGNATPAELLGVSLELAKRLGKEEPAALMRWLDRSIAGRPQGKEEAARLAGKEALALADGIDTEKRHQVFNPLCIRLKALWGNVGEEDALTVARQLAGTFHRYSANRLFQGDLAGVLAVIGKGPHREAAAVAARCLAQAVCPQDDWVRSYLWLHLREVAGRLRPEDAAATTRAVAAKVAKEGMKAGVHFYAAALAAMAGGSGPKEAAAAAAVVAQRMARPVEHPSNLHDLAGALGALAARLPREQAAAAVGPTARALTRQLAESHSDAESLSGALTALAPYLLEAEAAAAFRAATGRLAGAKSPLELAAVGEALAALAGRLERKETGGVLTPAAAILVERLAVEKDWKGRPALLAALPALGRRLNEAELVRLLQAPLCVGDARALVLAELGRRAGRPFADVWEFVEWARVKPSGR